MSFIIPMLMKQEGPKEWKIKKLGDKPHDMDHILLVVDRGNLYYCSPWASVFKYDFINDVWVPDFSWNSLPGGWGWGFNGYAKEGDVVYTSIGGFKYFTMNFGTKQVSFINTSVNFLGGGGGYFLNGYQNNYTFQSYDLSKTITYSDNVGIIYHITFFKGNLFLFTSLGIYKINPTVLDINASINLGDYKISNEDLGGVANAVEVYGDLMIVLSNQKDTVFMNELGETIEGPSFSSTSSGAGFAVMNNKIYKMNGRVGGGYNRNFEVLYKG